MNQRNPVNTVDTEGRSVHNVDMTNTNPASEALAATPTRVLVDCLLLMEVTRLESSLSENERMARAWIIEELEARYDVEAAMNAWADDVDAPDFGERSYVQALIEALPAEAVAA